MKYQMAAILDSYVANDISKENDPKACCSSTYCHLINPVTIAPKTENTKKRGRNKGSVRQRNRIEIAISSVTGESKQFSQ